MTSLLILCALGRQSEADLEGRKEALAQALFDHIPVGVGSQGIIPTTAADLEAALEMGMDWSLREARPGSGCTLARVWGSFGASCPPGSCPPPQPSWEPHWRWARTGRCAAPGHALA